MDKTKFKISNHEYIKINLEELNLDSDCISCIDTAIDYVNEKNNIFIRFGYEPFRSFCYFILKSGIIHDLLNNKKQLNKDIFNDLGFDYNQSKAGKEQFKESFLKYLWIGNSHKEIRPYYNSWFYNDENGNIIFEITSLYSWFYETKKAHPEKISYKKWIKNYKSVVKTIISKENLKEWVQKAEELAKIYKLNL